MFNIFCVLFLKQQAAAAKSCCLWGVGHRGGPGAPSRRRGADLRTRGSTGGEVKTLIGQAHLPYFTSKIIENKQT